VEDKTLTRKISKLNMHSIGKKSSRISQKLFNSMGLDSVTPDYSFEDLERKFSSLQKAAAAFCSGAQKFRENLHEVAMSQFNVAENVADLYGQSDHQADNAAGKNAHAHRQRKREVARFRNAHRSIISTYWNQYVIHMMMIFYL